MEVIIMRGPSGSGKSTWIDRWYKQDLWKRVWVVSADQFFVRNGLYQFEASKLGEAHARCLNNFLTILFDPAPEIETLIVDNTNTQLWEWMNYYLAAIRLKHQVRIMTTMPTAVSVEELAARNRHGVPAEIIARMVANYEVAPLGETQIV